MRNSPANQRIIANQSSPIMHPAIADFPLLLFAVSNHNSGVHNVIKAQLATNEQNRSQSRIVSSGVTSVRIKFCGRLYWDVLSTGNERSLGCYIPGVSDCASDIHGTRMQAKDGRDLGEDCTVWYCGSCRKFAYLI